MEPTASVPNVAMEITLTSSGQDGNEASKKMEMDKGSSFISQFQEEESP